MKNILLFLIIILINNISFSQEKNNKERDSIVVIAEKKEYKDVPFAIIDEVPVFPGCENFSLKIEKKRCLNVSMQKHIQRHFNTDIANCLEKVLVLNKITGKKEEQCTSGALSSGKKRIYVQFKIGKTGEIEDINVRAPHPKLKEEAYRIAKLLPKMIPGKEKGKPVRVGYTIPITFNVE